MRSSMVCRRSTGSRGTLRGHESRIVSAASNAASRSASSRSCWSPLEIERGLDAVERPCGDPASGFAAGTFSRSRFGAAARGGVVLHPGLPLRTNPRAGGRGARSGGSRGCGLIRECFRHVSRLLGPPDAVEEVVIGIGPIAAVIAGRPERVVEQVRIGVGPEHRCAGADSKSPRDEGRPEPAPPRPFRRPARKPHAREVPVAKAGGEPSLTRSVAAELVFHPMTGAVFRLLGGGNSVGLVAIGAVLDAILPSLVALRAFLQLFLLAVALMRLALLLALLCILLALLLAVRRCCRSDLLPVALAAACRSSRRCCTIGLSAAGRASALAILRCCCCAC